MEVDATRMCALLVGLPDGRVVGVAERPSWLRVTITVAANGRPECRVVASFTVTASARSCSSIWQCSVGRPGWSGTSNADDARAVVDVGVVDHPDRIGTVTPLGLDETLFARVGRFRTPCWSTQIVDVRRCQLLDVVPGCDSVEPCRWLAERDEAGRDQIEWATLDLSQSYRTVFDGHDDLTAPERCEGDFQLATSAVGSDPCVR